MLDVYCSARRPHPDICVMLLLPKVVHLGVIFAGVCCTARVNKPGCNCIIEAVNSVGDQLLAS